MQGEVFITIRLRGHLPEGVDANREAKYVARRIQSEINDNDSFYLEVKDAWVQTVRDDRK